MFRHRPNRVGCVEQPQGRGSAHRRSEWITTGLPVGPSSPSPPRPPGRHERARLLRRLRPRRRRGRRGHASGSCTGAPRRASARRAVDAFNEANPDGKRHRPARSRTTPTRPRSRRPSAPARPPRSSRLGRRQAARLRRSRPGRRPHRLARGEPRRQGQALRRRLRAPPPSTARSTPCRARTSAADRSSTTRSCSSRSAPSRPTTWDELMALVPMFNAAGIAPIVPGRAVALDQHDVAGVPLRPHRRPGGVRVHLRRRAAAWSQPGRDRRPHQDPGPRQGRRLHQRLRSRSPPTPTPTRRCSTPTRPR